jgi:glutamine---fructose-6-phosphate transaminase (isomerizing)
MSTPTVIEGGYFRDIFDQPRAVEATVERLEPSPALAAFGADIEAGRFRQVLLTGMGSSYHAFHPLFLRLIERGVPVAMVETSELIHYQRNLLAPGTLLVVLSQSGRSAEIVRLVELNARRAMLVGVTNDAASPLALQSDAAVVTCAGTEFTVSSKTYLASLIALEWLGEQLTGGSLERTRAELAAAPDAVAQYLSAWKQHVSEACESFAGVKDIFLAGRGPSLAAVGTGGLIVKESTHRHSEGMSAAAFRHGPFEMVSASVFLMVFEGEPRTAELNRRLAADVIAAGGKAAVVGESASPGVFRLPAAPARLRPILEILPVEMTTLALAALDGREAGAFGLATKITATE